MAAPTLDGAAVFDTLLPEIRKAFSNIPYFGSAGIEVQFNEGKPTAFKFIASVTHLSRTTRDGGRR